MFTPFLVLKFADFREREFEPIELSVLTARLFLIMVIIERKIDCKGTLRPVFICLRPPTLPGFFGVVKQFFRFCLWPEIEF
jgi:hypothetical protein